MTPPLLRLAFVQGPRDGESLEYKPGSTIRIGRVVRGNEIAIKDAGISTKHLRIVSDSENWIVRDLGSSNGTELNSVTLDPDTAVNLRHGDVIKLGEVTSFIVNFVTDVQVQEHKLPPRPRRNNKRLAVADSDLDPVELVQEKPTRKGRSSKQEEHEVPKRTRASRSRNMEDVTDKEKESEVDNEKKVNSRVSRSRKKVAITKEEDEVPQEEKGNTETAQNFGLNSIKLEIEDTPKGMGMSAMKRATRSKQIENACLNSATRATRSKKNEIGGDSFMELEMVLNKARKDRAMKKKMEQKPSKSIIVEMEGRNDDIEENNENEASSDNKCDKEDETEKVEMELSMNRKLGEEEMIEDEEREQISSTKKLEEMTLGEWFDFMEVQLRKQIIEETEKLIEPMRSKARRVHKYIEEQKQAKGKESLS